jgi:predicted nucleotidyltransferase
MTSDSSDLLAQCRYPDVAEHYLVALKEAVEYIVREFDVLGIIAAGSIIRGQAHATSDWDIYVIHTQPQRQMIQRFFGGMPAQIFLNPPAIIRRYFQSEAAEGVCTTAHMLTTGFVVLDRDPFIETIRGEAREVMAAGPQVSEASLTMRRYHLASQFENAFDIMDSDPNGGSMLLGETIAPMLRIYFLRHNIFIPRDKELLQKALEADPELGQWVQDFYTLHDLEQRLSLARKIADRTMQAQGFFECETPLETLEFPGD